MAAPKTSPYPGLQSINDGPTQTALRLIWDHLNAQKGRDGSNPTFLNDLDLSGFKATSAGDPTDSQDLVTKSYADATYGPAAAKVALQVGGSAPLDVTGLAGASSGIFIGLHAQRIANPPALTGQFFIESDRLALYQSTSNPGQWTLLGNFLGSGGLVSGLFSDLTGTDDSYRFWAIDEPSVIYRWDGNLWRRSSGVYIAPFGSRPLWSAVDTGLLFAASDMGYQMWIADYASAAWLFIGGGNPMRGTISPDQKPSLGAHDTEFRFTSTDFDRKYRWTGSTWQDAEGQPERGMYVDFEGTAPAGNGWVPADGNPHPISTSSGGTTSVTPHNIANYYYRG